MNYDVIIGLEIHAEIKSQSKMFCSCPNEGLKLQANTAICPICLGHPGTLPRPNQLAIDQVILLGLALNGQINRLSKFDRKNYFYPDLPKGYQISQYDLPLVRHGFLEVNQQKINLDRIHLEEDTAKLSHPSGKNYTLVDFNRAGVPLLELVTEPTIREASSARMFCETLQQILRYLDISSANMEKGEMRCEVNISLQQKNSWFKNNQGQIESLKGHQLNNKVEIKNINSFKAIDKAIAYEIERQSRILDQGLEVPAETRGFNDQRSETTRQRTKENSADYRYFPEPDIRPIKISPEKIAKIKKRLIELPTQKKTRFIKEYGLNPAITEILIADKKTADWYEKVMSELHAWIKSVGQSWENQNISLAQSGANWITTELFKYLKRDKKDLSQIKINPENMAELLLLLHEGKISATAGQLILKTMYDRGGDPSDLMTEMELEQKSDNSGEELEKTIGAIIKNYPKQWSKYLQGKEVLLQFFIGQVMAETKGRWPAQKIKEIIIAKSHE